MPIEIKQRGSGTTTRIVDRCIQELFKNGITYVYEGRLNTNAQVEIMFKFKRRMQNEHNHVNFTKELVNQDGIICYKVQIKE